MAEIVGYYERGWRRRRFTCSGCRWSGQPERDMSPEMFDELMTFGCPRCGETVLIVSYPTIEEIRDAAARGIPEAVAIVEALDRRDDEGSST